MRLLLVDSRIVEAQKFLDAANESTQAILYNFYEDTYESVLNKVSFPDFESVGFVFDGNSNRTFRFLYKEATIFIDNKESWNIFGGFMNRLNSKTFDFMACELYSNKLWKETFEYLENKYNINIRASSDKTGNLTAGGNWVMETDDINVKDLYFTDVIESYKNLLDRPIYEPYIKSNNLNDVDIQLRKGGNVYIWGGAGGTSKYLNGSYGQIPNLSNVIAVYGSQGAFAALLEDGSVYVWGNASIGGSNVINDFNEEGFITVEDVKLTNVKTIRSNGSSFAALLRDGRVCVWGNPEYGGSPNGMFGSGNPMFVPGLNNAKTIISSNYGSYAIITIENKVWIWGNNQRGGTPNFNTGNGEAQEFPGLVNVKNIYTSNEAFAALLEDGRVYVWGNPFLGGATSLGGSAGYIEGLIAVKSITGSPGAFAAIKSDNSVFIWGDPFKGGSLNSTPATGYITISSLSNVSKIYSNNDSFAALTKYGTVYVWGQPYDGGSPIISGINNSGDYTPGFIPNLTNVIEIVPAAYAYAAITQNRKVYIWGWVFVGGADIFGDSGNTGGYNVRTNGYVSGATNIKSLISNEIAFSGILNNGYTYSWGEFNSGGVNPKQYNLNNVKETFGTNFAFVSLKEDGTVYPWGVITNGGNPVQTENLKNVIKISSTFYAFAAITNGSGLYDINKPVNNTPWILAIIAGVILLAVIILYFYSGYSVWSLIGLDGIVILAIIAILLAILN